MSMNLKKWGLSFAGVAILSMAAVGCKPSDSQSNRERAQEAQTEIMSRAQSAVKVPQITNFQNREAIAEYMRRMDDPNKTFYTYILSMRGDVIGYYVTRTHPVSVCELMTPPKQKYEQHGDPDPLGPAPTLNGTYGSGGGNCDHYYAFTAGSDTMIEFSNDFFISDKPLSLEADQIKPQGEGN